MKTIIFTREEPQGFTVYAECKGIKINDKIKVDGSYQTVINIKEEK